MCSQYFEKYKVNLDQPIGKGVFGDVFHCSTIKTIPSIPNNLAAKRIFLDSKKIDIKEIEILSKLDHPNIIRLYDVILTNSAIFLILEYATIGDLMKYVSKLPDQRLSEDQTLEILVQIASALDYAVKTWRIIHRDIKPANILLSDDNMVKLADFGFARFIDDPSKRYKMTNAIGSLFYMAPEIFKGEAYNSKCDVWSVGIMIYELIYGFAPWIKGKFDSDHFKKIDEDREIKFPIIKGVKISEELKDLISKMLIYNVDERIDWEGVKKHSILNKSLKFKSKQFLKDEIRDLMISLTENYQKLGVSFRMLYEILFFLQKILVFLKKEDNNEFKEKTKAIIEDIYKFMKSQDPFERNILEKEGIMLGFRFQRKFKEICEEFLRESTKRKYKKLMESTENREIKKILIWLLYLRNLQQLEEKTDSLIKKEIEELAILGINQLLVSEGIK